MKKIKVKECGTIVTGNTPSKKNGDFYNSDDINFFTPSDFNDNVLNELTEAKNFISNKAKEKARILPRDSVLVTCIGIIGKVGIVNKESAFNQQINAIIPNKAIVNNRYLAYYFIAKSKFLRQKANAPVVPIINKTNFENIDIVLPTIDRKSVV